MSNGFHRDIEIRMKIRTLLLFSFHYDFGPPRPSPPFAIVLLSDSYCYRRLCSQSCCPHSLRRLLKAKITKSLHASPESQAISRLLLAEFRFENVNFKSKSNRIITKSKAKSNRTADAQPYGAPGVGGFASTVASFNFRLR